MKRSRSWWFLLAALTGIAAVAVSQDGTLKGRSALELNLGLWGSSKASTTTTTVGVTTEASTNGFGGNLLYAYWMREHLSLTVSAGFLAGKVTNSVGLAGIDEHASAVIPVLIGVRFYVPHPEPGETIRLFLSAAIGSYIGSEAQTTGLSQQAHTEAAFGGRAGIGVDFLLGSHFKLGAGAGYNLMTDFESPVGGKKNYNGGDFTIGIGFVF